MYYTDTSRGFACAKDPAVASFLGRYWLYYSLPPRKEEPEFGWRIAVAVGDDLDNFERICELSFDIPCCRNGVGAPGVLVRDGWIHLFFQTYGNWEKDAICYARSRDGIHFETAKEPIFHPNGNWNSGRAIDADVIEWNNRLLLLCATRDPEMKVQMLVAAEAPLVEDFGTARFQQICEESVLKPELEWEKICIEAPALCSHNGSLYMFYGGAYNNAPQQIGCAKSEDGIHWQRVSSEPVLPNGKPNSWNSYESGHPFVFEAPDGKYHLFYQGNNDGISWHLSRREIFWNNGIPEFGPETIQTGCL